MARKSRKQTAAPMPAPSLYVHVALYIRLSVEDNKKRGCSVENQKLVLNDFLSDKPDFVVYDTYIDNGATGTNFHRPGFQQMLSDIEAGHINCVIVKDLSRLGRNSIDTGYYIEQYFHAHNVRFIAVTDQFDTADSGNLHGGIMLPLKNMINEAYALDIGRKIKAQARQAMKDGDYIGARAPYGYRKDPDDCHKLLIDENTAPVVKQIFEWAHEHVALNRIVRNLNEMGIPAPSHYKKTTGEITSPGLIGSGKWQTRTVMKILESEVYTGDLVQGKTKIVDKAIDSLKDTCESITILSVKNTLNNSILSPYTECESVGDYSRHYTHKGKECLFSNCSKFKGLEADAIILIDVDSSTFDKGAMYFYVGASRARRNLEIISNATKEDCALMVRSLNPKAPLRRDPISMLKVLLSCDVDLIE